MAHAAFLQYDYSPPYADPALRKVLPDFQTMYILLLILLEVIWLALCTHRTVKVLARGDPQTDQSHRSNRRPAPGRNRGFRR